MRILEKEFSIFIPYKEECLDDLKTIMGRKYSIATKKTSFPSIEIYNVADILENHYPAIAARLLDSDRFKQDRFLANKAENMVYMSRAKRSRFVPKCPDGLKPFPFQSAGVYYATIGGRDNVLIADEMGLGKTITAILIANEHHFQSGLIITTNSAKINWQKEIRKWSTVTDNVSVLDAQSTARDIERAEYITINYEGLKKHYNELKKKKFKFVACDEAHKIKNVKAQRSIIALEFCDEADYRAIITGSPIVNRPVELWNLLSALNPFYWHNWFDYVYRYCDAQTDEWTGKLLVNGASHLDELQQKLRMTVMLRRLKRDVAKDIPPKTRQVVEIPASKKFTSILNAQEKYVGKLQKAIDISANIDISLPPSVQEKLFRESVKKSGLTAKDFDDMSRLRRMTALAKAPEVIEFAEGILESKPKVGIFAYHVEVQKYFIDHFGKKAVHIVAGMSAAKREAAKERFQTDPRISVFVGSIMAAGESITLTAADVCIMAELSWVPGINSQVEDRFHRIGTINPVMIYYVMLQNSVDYYVANMVISKLEVIEKALDIQTMKRTIRRRR